MGNTYSVPNRYTRLHKAVMLLCLSAALLAVTSYVNSSTASSEVKMESYADIIKQMMANPNRYTEPYRDQYHFTPIEGWMNDPNGLVFFGGKWHMFYQHRHPLAPAMSWGHAISTDLIHWEHVQPAILPDSQGMIFSGSAVVDKNDTSGFFGGKPGVVAIYTYHGADNYEDQAIAYSADGINFTKYEKNPVIPKLKDIPGQPDYKDFRDPKVFWHEPTKRWIMVVAGGLLRFYSSPNLRDWTFESINSNIETECPDFYELPIDGSAENKKWVLSGGGRWYMLGKFDGKIFTPESDQIPMNYGVDCYASQTFSDVPDGRRIMISWLYWWAYKDWPTQPWSGGGMTIPYELKLRTLSDGVRLVQEPVKETEALRGERKYWDNQTITPASNILDGMHGKTLELIAEFQPGSASEFGVKMRKGKDEETIVGYRVADKKLFLDRSHSGLKTNPEIFDKVSDAPMELIDGKVKMRIFLDWSSVEVIGNDGAKLITHRILPSDASDGLEVYAKGGEAKLVSLNVYEMKSVWR
ncbi:MAG: glycoside hydrolase family 32 protein [Armatimonadota bacterium]|nr:glycoside hydrolase family 32 protein [bacterium]